MTDVVIIGGGIAGVSAAARLAGAATVTLIEAEDRLAHHASGRSAALYEPRYGAPPVVALSLASGDEFRAGDGLLSPRGLMLLAGPDERQAFDRDLAAMDFHEITVAEARAIVPILNPATVAFAGLADHAWDIDTDRLIQGYARSARQAGATFMTGARVSAIVREGGRWQVSWPGGAVAADLIVNAAGAWVDDVARMAGVRPLGFTPLRRSMARIPAPDGQDVRAWPMIFGAGETWYAKPDAGALIVSPAEEHATEPHDAWADDMVLAEGLARYETMVTAPVTRVIANWAGLRTFAPDRVPVIGHDPAVSGFFWLAGQGGYGFQSAPAASRLAADLILGRAPEIPSAVVAALDPARLA